MFKKSLCISLLFSIFSCTSETKKDFQFGVNEFVAEYAPLFPDETPLSINNPELVHLHIPEDSIVNKVRLFHEKFATQIKSYTLSEIPVKLQADFNKMEKILKNIDFYLKNYPSNPTYFNVLHGFQRILNSNYAPANQRLQTLFEKLGEVPLFYEAAKGQLNAADVKKSTETLEKHIQTYAFFDKTLPQILDDVHFMTPQYQARLDAAKLAIRDYVAFVESLRLQ
jgi:hypothetical protein